MMANRVPGMIDVALAGVVVQDFSVNLASTVMTKNVKSRMVIV